MSAGSGSLYRSLPSIDRLLRDGAIVPLLDTYDRAAVTRMVRRVVAEERVRRTAGGEPRDAARLAEKVVALVRSQWTGWPSPVINATGAILHTNLGRAPLSNEAVAAMAAAAGYTTLEVDVLDGRRGSRHERPAALLRALVGSEDAVVAGNNGAGVLVTLTALCRGKEVIVSRGQAVEIGGGFRVPDILRQSGARLVEVGTTNRTRLTDYEDAITERTAAILHVHPSNFRLVGFTGEVPLEELGQLAESRGIRLIVDNGSGALLDTAAFGLRHEPTPAEALDAGADIVCFSADKLLGGPQAGIVAGSEEAVARVRRHPLMRAVRPDKTALAALCATLLTYIRGEPESLPVWRMIGASVESIQARSQRFQDQAREVGLDASLTSGLSTVGGGSLPGETLPTVLIALPGSVTARALRRSHPAVFGREIDKHVSLDLRTVAPDQDTLVLRLVKDAVGPMLDSAAQ